MHHQTFLKGKNPKISIFSITLFKKYKKSLTNKIFSPTTQFPKKTKKTTYRLYVFLRVIMRLKPWFFILVHNKKRWVHRLEEEW